MACDLLPRNEGDTGADAFKRDQPQAGVHFYDTGHFALETHAAEIQKFLTPLAEIGEGGPCGQETSERKPLHSNHRINRWRSRFATARSPLLMVWTTSPTFNFVPLWSRRFMGRRSRFFLNRGRLTHGLRRETQLCLLAAHVLKRWQKRLHVPLPFLPRQRAESRFDQCRAGY